MNIDSIIGLVKGMQSFNIKKVTTHTLLGGMSAYVIAKQQGITDNTAIVVAIASAVTSCFTGVSDTQK